MADIVLKIEGAGATKQVTLIPSALVAEISDLYLARKPIPQKPNPDYDPDDPESEANINAYGAAVHFINTVVGDFRRTCAQEKATRKSAEGSADMKAMEAAGAFGTLTE